MLISFPVSFGFFPFSEIRKNKLNTPVQEWGENLLTPAKMRHDWACIFLSKQCVYDVRVLVLIYYENNMDVYVEYWLGRLEVNLFGIPSWVRSTGTHEAHTHHIHIVFIADGHLLSNCWGLVHRINSPLHSSWICLYSDETEIHTHMSPHRHSAYIPYARRTHIVMLKCHSTHLILLGGTKLE